MGLLGKNSRTFRPFGGHRGGRGFLPDTPVIHEVMDERIRNGAVGFTRGLLNTYFADAGLLDDTKSRSSQRDRAYKYLVKRGWTKQTVAPGCVICYSPVAKADQVVKLAKLAFQELRMQDEFLSRGLSLVRKTLRVPRNEMPECREKLREKIIKDAMAHKDPFVAYIHRAAKVCGLVRGYQWP